VFIRSPRLTRRWWTAPVAVVDDDDASAVACQLLGLVSEALDRSSQTRGAFGDREGGIEPRAAEPLAVALQEVDDRRRVHEERLEGEQSRRFGRLGEDGTARAEQGAQAHDKALAQVVDGRVGDLGEALAEVVVHGSRPARERGQRRVVAHGEGGVLGVVRHRPQHHGQLHLGVAEAGLAPLDLLGRIGLLDRAPGVELAQSVARPTGVGGGGRQALLALGVVDDPAGGVDEQHLAGTEAAALDEAVTADVHGARL
jgi:hypothetical protein